MSAFQEAFQSLQHAKENAQVHVESLGNFSVYVLGEKLENKAWGRDKTIQLFQYLVSNRQRNALHKEKIMDDLWEDWNDRDFKVALHGINKVLEPNRPSRTDPKYVVRQGVSYQINLDLVWIDVEALEQYVALGNKAIQTEKEIAKKAYEEAIKLYKGTYLPNRIYEDWTSEEREKSQLLILGAYINLAEINLKDNPTESIRLAQKAIQIDAAWEEAYRIQMQAYMNRGNRPQAIKAYLKCEIVLEEEYGIAPLPETKKLLQEIEAIG